MSPLDLFRSALAASDFPAAIVSNLPSVEWLTGFTGSFGLVLVTLDAGVLITDSRYTIQAGEQCRTLSVESFANPRKVEDVLREQCAALGVRRVAIDCHQVTIGTLEKWSAALPGIELLPAQDPIDKLRMIKTADEVAKLRAACQITDDALAMLLGKLRPGITELELLWAFEDFLRPHGATPAFPPIVLTGERTARPHGSPSRQPLQRGDFVTFDIGARLNGYNSDITRTFVLGQASDRQRQVYGQLLKAQKAAIAALRPGVKGSAVDAVARTILDELDLAQYFGHGLGHGLGALVHDTGRLSPIVDTDIEVGQVWTIEPGVYIPDFGGVRIEDDLLVTPDGCEPLTFFDKELIEVSC